jgi:hypothetical protein
MTARSNCLAFDTALHWGARPALASVAGFALSRKRQLLELCARIGYTPPVR